MKSKKWYKSKTMNTNMVAALGAISAFLSGTISKETAITTIVMCLMNCFLRIKTTQPLSKKKKQYS